MPVFLIVLSWIDYYPSLLTLVNMFLLYQLLLLFQMVWQQLWLHHIKLIWPAHIFINGSYVPYVPNVTLVLKFLLLLLHGNWWICSSWTRSLSILFLVYQLLPLFLIVLWQSWLRKILSIWYLLDIVSGLYVLCVPNVTIVLNFCSLFLHGT